MESVLVATFDDRTNAQAGLEKLLELDALDDITFYSLALIHKKREGPLEILYYDGPDWKRWPVQEAVIGALVGALGGPVGIVVGLMAGGITGSLNQSRLETASQQFLQKIQSQLTPDSYALALDVEEIDPLIIDSYLQPFRGVVTRTALSTLDPQEGLEEWEAATLNTDQTTKKLEKAQREVKAALQAKMQQVIKGGEQRMKEWKQTREYLKTKLQQKVKRLDKKITDTEGKTRENLLTHRNNLQKNLKQWEKQSTGASP